MGTGNENFFAAASEAAYAQVRNLHSLAKFAVSLRPGGTGSGSDAQLFATRRGLRCGWRQQMRDVRAGDERGAPG